MTNNNRALSQTRIIYLATTIFLVVLSFYAFTQLKNLIDSSNLVRHTNQVNLSLEKIAAAIIDAETNQRGYLLTGDSLLLSKRDTAFKHLTAELIFVDSLTKDNSQQIENLKAVHLALDDKLESMKIVLGNYTPLQMKAEFKANIVDGVHKMEKVREQISNMATEENNLLKLHTQSYYHFSVVTPLFTIVLFLGALLILFISYFRINTALKYSQELQVSLEKEKTFAQTILDSSPDNIVVLDKELRYLTANPAAVKILNKLTPDYFGKKVTDLFPNSDAIADMNRALKGESLHHHNFYSEFAKTHFEVIYTPLKKDNEVIGIIAQSRDISKTLKTNLQLEKQNEELEKRNNFISTILNSSGDIILVFDTDLKFISANKTALEYYSGFYHDSIIGKTLTEVNPNSPKDGILEALKGNPVIWHKFKSTLYDRYHEISYIPLRNKNEVYAVVVISHDITDAIKRQEELERINKELQSFAYISSHDLQEPLRKIQTFSTRIVEQEFNNLSEQGKDNFNRMQAAAKRMQTLIEDLLAYSRTSTDERKYETTDLNKIIDEVKEDLKEELIDKSATIEATELCDVNIIPFQFRQLMHNLIGNALKFSKPETPPHIQIKSKIAEGIRFNNSKLSPQKKYCHISISDNGIGFEQQYSEKIFEVFQRLHGKTAYNGTGIGLSIVKKIVENHEGVITATSELNKGASFDIYLPAT